MSLLIVSAARFEAETLLSALENLQFPHEYFACGIGPLHAARSAHVLAEKCQGREVFYLGSCGSFYPFHSPSLITVGTVYWMPACIRTGIGGFPEHLYPPIKFPESTLDLSRKSVLTSASVSLVGDFSPEARASLPAPEELVENAELYACADALLKAKKLHIVLGVTNEVGSEGRKQWARHFQTIADITAEFLLRSRSFRGRTQ